MGKKDNKTTQTTKAELPDYIVSAGKDLLSRAQSLANKPFETYTGNRVADFKPDQMNAFQRIRDMLANSPIVGPEAMEGARRYGSAPAQQIGMERIVDEDGRLGKIADYLNPHVDAALEPAIRRIMEAAGIQRNQIGSNATTAGAYGDARHGIADAALNRDTQTTVGDTASRVFMDAFSQAMGHRAGDQGRFMAADEANAQLSERALERDFQGSGALIDRANADQNRLLTGLRELLMSGTAQQTQDQAGLDAAFQEFLRKYGHDFDVLGALGGALSSTPYAQQQTTVQDGGKDKSGMQAIGAVAGAVLPKLLAFI